MQLASAAVLQFGSTQSVPHKTVMLILSDVTAQVVTLRNPTPKSLRQLQVGVVFPVHPVMRYRLHW
jgi:hypothetical protein